MSYVGFSQLPGQAHRRMVRKGFEFTLMLVGESGLGKSTLCASLFDVDKDYHGIDSKNYEVNGQTVDITKSEIDVIEENGVRLKMTVVDTPGFGGSLDISEQQVPISNFIDDQFNSYYAQETGINRRNIMDTRVHCCFYFVSPHSNGLRPMDIEFMKQLHHKVNIVPLLAKSDTLTPQEIAYKKGRIMQDIKANSIRIYTLPDGEEEPIHMNSSEAEKRYKQDLEILKNSIPYAVVGSTDVYDINGKRVRGRAYPWGVVEVENMKHSEFGLLKNMLITQMQDFQDVTHDFHYENYRTQKIAEDKNARYNRSNNSYISHNSMHPSGDCYSSEVNQSQLAEKDAEIQKMRDMMARMQRELAIQGGKNY